MILLSTLSPLTCGNNLVWLLNLKLTFKILLILMYAEKSQLSSFDRSNYSGAVDVKIDESCLNETNFQRCWYCLSVLS